MTTIYMIMFFVIGLFFGSFYNVVGYRLPKGASIVFPPSHCPNCKHRLGALELIPVLSFFIQRGKCKHCHEKIALFYPIIEFSTGLLFAVSFYSYKFKPELVIALVLVSLLMIIVVSDLNYLIIPDSVLIVSSIIILIIKFISGGYLSLLRSLGCGLLLFSLMYIIMLLGNMMFKKESLGGGDIKLMFVAGLVLHPLIGVFSIFLSSLFALIPSLFLYYKNEEHVIPFGPFILFAVIILFLMKIDVNNIYNFINSLCIFR